LSKQKDKYTQLMADINTEVFVERLNQNAKFGFQRHSWGKWLGILGEEFGEVCQAINRIHFPKDAKETDADNLYKELIQLAAVAAAMAEQFKESQEEPF
jgi:NTP pyrophosphatase (non-canonical NTP hydrolase)